MATPEAEGAPIPANPGDAAPGANLGDLAARIPGAPEAGQARPVNKGGRRTAAEEATAWCAANGFRMVPMGEQPEMGGLPTGDPAGGYCLPPGFVKRCTQIGLSGLDESLQTRVRIEALALGANPATASDIAKGAGAPAGGIDVLSECAEEILKEFGLLQQHGAKAAAVVVAGAWLIGYRTTVEKLTAMRKEYLAQAQPTP